MDYISKTGSSFIPDGVAEEDALRRITHLGIGAHQDDLEIMALHGIAECYGSRDHWFGGVTCTNGAGSPRVGPYADYTDEEMVNVRHEEQEKAAVLGGYGAMLQLGHSSNEVNNVAGSTLAKELAQIIAATRPSVVYTHNPADKHDTHVAVFASAIKAIRSLPVHERPTQFLGGEVWGDLDWLPDELKVALDVTQHPSLAAALIDVFRSQNLGGKRYDHAAEGRRIANATFFSSHTEDQSQQLCFAMDLTPLITDDDCSVEDFVSGLIQQFHSDARNRIRTFMG